MSKHTLKAVCSVQYHGSFQRCNSSIRLKTGIDSLLENIKVMLRPYFLLTPDGLRYTLYLGVELQLCPPPPPFFFLFCIAFFLFFLTGLLTWADGSEQRQNASEYASRLGNSCLLWQSFLITLARGKWAEAAQKRNKLEGLPPNKLYVSLLGMNCL